jgi:two-component system nitrogen regulation sensor histidine kinase NtrY
MIETYPAADMPKTRGWWAPTAAAAAAALCAVLLSAAQQAPVLATLLALAAGLAAAWPLRHLAQREAERLQLATEQTRARERRLADRQRLFEEVMGAAPVALLLYSDSGTIAYANPAAQELFFEGQECEGKNFLKLLAAAPRPLGAALLAGEDGLARIEVDGATQTYHVSRRECGSHGSLFSHDPDQPADSRRAGQDGEPYWLLIVRQLTSEMSRSEVDVLKRVIRVISHELNNSLAPIRSLVGSARLIGKKPEHHDKLERVLDTIDERATHLGNFVDGYARLARLPEPRPAAVALAPLVARLEELYPDAAFKAPAKHAWLDVAQLEQVLINLLKNASEAGGPTEDIELAAEVDAQGATYIEVRDRGPGLRPEAAESVFLPFYSTKPAGSGLGLALCREIIHAHGGHISLRNRGEGGGCVAALWLPGPQRGADIRTSRSRLTLTRP